MVVVEWYAGLGLLSALSLSMLAYYCVFRSDMGGAARTASPAGIARP